VTPSLGTNASVNEPGERLRALRKALGLTQKEVAERSGQVGWDHTYVVRSESGGNKLSSASRREGLARGLGVSAADFEAYVLRGACSLEEVVARASRPPVVAASSPPQVAGVSTETVEDASRPATLTEAIGLALDQQRGHTYADGRAVEAALGANFQLSNRTDPVGFARKWLDAARNLRLRKVLVNHDALVEEVTDGGDSRARQADAPGTIADNEVAAVGVPSDRPVAGTEGMLSERGDDSTTSDFRKPFVPVRDASGKIVGVTGGELIAPKVAPVAERKR